MDAKRRRMRDDWRGHFRGELLLDDVSRGLYATDASLFEIEPLAVAVPRDEEDLRFIVRYAAEQQIPIIARGAGTGVAGEALGSGVVVDLSVHFRTILEVGSETVRVQPGVVHRDLNVVLAKQGRRFAPDPASSASCTIGGMLATNASGSNVAIHGYTREHVAQLRVLWDNGDAAVVGNQSSADDEPRTRRLGKAVTDLLEPKADLIRLSQPRTPFNRCGYLLHDVFGPQGLDLAKLLVGSEGTLALFSEAVLRTIPLPGGRSAVLFGFDTLDAALRGAAHARLLLPTACELLDRRLLMLARGYSAELVKAIPPSAEAILLVEFERDSWEEARQAGLESIDLLQRLHHLATLAMPAFDEDSIARLWEIRNAVLPALYSLSRGPRPLAFVEDIGVPPDDLPEFLSRLHVVLQRFETTASFMIHASTGQIHARPFLDLDKPADVEKLWAIAEETYALAIDMGGTISTQHGTGIARTPWVEKQYGLLFPIFRELKNIFDPNGLFNPGKIIGLDPSRPAWPLRKRMEKPVEPKQPLLLWQADEIAVQVASCNGCGSCRTEQPDRRMCPTFRVSHEEAATPRAKANLLRRMLGPNVPVPAAGDLRGIADLCINCKMCAHECPAHVNIPKLMLEAKAADHAEHGLDRADWMLARIESLAALAGNFALVSNTLLGNRPFRWIMERLFGLSRRRRMPLFAAHNFLRRAQRRGWSRKRRKASKGPRVAYFVDLFPNVFDPLIAEATVAVLHHHGIEVYVPPHQKPSGMSPLAQGDVEAASDTVRHNLRLFAELAREGYTIICSEPTAAIMLRQDALDLLDDPDARLVADSTVELTTYLSRLHDEGKLRTDFQPLDLSIGHHVPCHMKALGAGVHSPTLLSLIPQLKVHTIDKSCSGMAGPYGLKAKNFAASLEAGRPMLDEMRRPRILFGSTECGSCRMQMEQGSNKRTLHPVQYLALAYGLLPEIERMLHEPMHELFT